MTNEHATVVNVVTLTERQLEELVQRTWEQARKTAQQREVMTRDELAVFLGCDPRTVANWVRDKGLPEHTIGRDKRYRRSEILQWLGEK